MPLSWCFVVHHDIDRTPMVGVCHQKADLVGAQMHLEPLVHYLKLDHHELTGNGNQAVGNPKVNPRLYTGDMAPGQTLFDSLR